ncbi:MAG: MBL fold metallo-hydrolase [Desulfitobacterium hafniense]|nr:MBL fold metallo-hydrolase [Desulfitobacterium hafniense]
MHFATLASGSSGNAILVGSGGRSLLIDCGISAKALLHNLSMLNESSSKVKIDHSQIEGIVITHEHRDHITGIGVVARKLRIPIYATSTLWSEIENSIGKIQENQRVEVNSEAVFTCAGLGVKLFRTSHDSRESYGLKIQESNGDYKHTIGIATDTGIITEEMNEHLKGCDALVVEANHDKDRLWQGGYPWYLKKRINGIYGHLENKQLAEGLLEWIEENTQRVVLAHLSEENNTPDLALSTVARILKDSAISRKNPRLRLRVAPRFTPHELIVLGEE